MQAGHIHQRLQVVQARQAQAGLDQVAGQRRVHHRPGAGHQHGHGVAAGRMAHDDDAARVGVQALGVAPGPGGGVHHLQRDLRHRQLRAKGVIGHHGGRAQPVHGAGDEAVLRLVQRLPVAAVDKHHQRRAGARGGKGVQGFLGTAAVGHIQLARQAAARQGRFGRPADKVVAVIRDPHAVVVHALQPLRVGQVGAVDVGGTGHGGPYCRKRQPPRAAAPTIGA